MRIWATAILGILVAGCGGGGGGTTPTTLPPPVAAPPAQPSPTPSPTPSSCPDGACDNTNTVVRAQVRLYQMFDENRLPVPAPDPVRQVVQEPIPVGYTVRLDVSGKDATGDETNGNGQIEWFYSGQDLVHTNARSPWQRDIIVAAPGTWSVYVIFDGVGSNDLNFTFVAR